MQETIQQLQGRKEGGASIILAGIHGNEICSIKALSRYSKSASIDRGTLYVGLGNPKAIQEQKRFIDVNLNRLFLSDTQLSEQERASVEYKQMQYIRQYLDASEALLDLHASTIPNTPPFIVCEPSAFSIAQYLPVQYVVSGFSEFEPGATDGYMETNKKIGICVECGFIDSSAAESVAEQCIQTFLCARKHQKTIPRKQKQQYFRIFKKYFSKTNNFRLRKSFENFEHIQQGEIIGHDGEEEVRAENTGIILFAHHCTNVGDEAFLLAAKERSPIA